MKSKPFGKALQVLALVICAGTLFARTASALPERDGEPADQASEPAPSPESIAASAPDAADLANRVDVSGLPGNDVQWGTRAHVYPWQAPTGLTDPRFSSNGDSPASGPNLDGFSGTGPVPLARANAHTLTYYGGPVISNVNVVKVNYGTGTYQSYVSGTGSGTMSAFFNGIVGSPYFGWLNSNYKTPTQTIGNGSYGGNYTITPSAANNGATIDDTNIQAELVAQINAGHLPAATKNSLYFVYFPKGKKITQGGSPSCAAGGFCAYHGTIKAAAVPGGYLFYAVMPDNSTGSGCDSGCGTSTPYNNWCSVSSHELIEAVTDAGVGVATTYASPLAWYNKTYGEIGDICNAQQATVVGTDGVTYTVQKEWSNSTNTCRSQ